MWEITGKSTYLSTLGKKTVRKKERTRELCRVKLEGRTPQSSKKRERNKCSTELEEDRKKYAPQSFATI